ARFYLLARLMRQVLHVVVVHHDDPNVVLVQHGLDCVVEFFFFFVVGNVCEPAYTCQPKTGCELLAPDDTDLLTLTHTITSSSSISSPVNPASLPRAIARMLSTSRSFARMYAIIGQTESGY